MRKVSTLILPRIEGMMTGVWKIDRAHELVVLTYEDGKTESAKITAVDWIALGNNPIKIVGAVQAQRKAAQ